MCRAVHVASEVRVKYYLFLSSRVLVVIVVVVMVVVARYRVLIF